MKNLFFCFVAIAVFAIMPNRTMAQTAADASGTIIAPISLTKTANLDFGSMSVSPTVLGTCVLAADASRTKTGGVSLSSLGTPTVAAFTVGGTGTAGYAITLPATITVVNGASDMIINGLIARNGLGVDGLTSALVGGADTFTVRGTLNVNAAQPTGLYTVSFNVTVVYN